MKITSGLEGASKTEKFLLGWWIWALLVNGFNLTLPFLATLLLLPIVVPSSLFLSEDQVTSVVGFFITFSWIALIVGGVMYTKRKGSLNKTQSNE